MTDTDADIGTDAALRCGVAVSGLSIRRGRRMVVQDVTFEAAGGVLAIAGANGAGKSSLLRALATLQPVATGSVRLAGGDLASRAGRRRARAALGFLGQHPEFPGSFRVEEALRYAAWLQRITDVPTAVDRVCASLDLAPVRGDRLATLSGGTRQRVLLGQAVIHDPPIVLLDEPTVGVDVEHRVGLRQYLRTRSQHGLVVVTTHITEDIELLADRVLVLREGHVVFDGSPDALASGAPAAEGSRIRPVEAALQQLGAAPARRRRR